MPSRTRKPKRSARSGPARPVQKSRGAKYVYRFDEIRLAERAAGSWDGVRALLGGKGANLAEMTKLKVPVPPGFVVTTAACNAFLAAKSRFPKGLWEEVLE
ncbi:MAG: hypothetical protein OEN48_13335, partial [Betaproteobacteria bacterium]|nr:hypothetical protein [Betaproteobacteria bacterium]